MPTCCGQIRLPGLGALVVPSRFGRRFDRGHFDVEGTHLIVSAGVGSGIRDFRAVRLGSGGGRYGGSAIDVACFGNALWLPRIQVFRRPWRLATLLFRRADARALSSKCERSPSTKASLTA
jgi:hypothetical protein